MTEEPIAYDEFARADSRVGRIRAVADPPRALVHRSAEPLETPVATVVDGPAENTAGFSSQVLILGVPAEDGPLAPLRPDRGVRPGGRVH